MNYKFLNIRPLNVDLAALILRVTFGGLFIYHGFSKIQHFNQILPMFQGHLGMGPKLPFLLVIFAEFFCGIFVLLGFLTRLTVVPIFITMSVAFFIAHAKDPFMIKELAFLFWLLSLVIFTLGSGKYSIDSFIFKNKG